MRSSSLLGDPLGLAEVADQIGEAPYGVQALPQLDPDVEVPVVDLAARRKTPKGAEGVLEASHCLLMGRARRGLATRHVEKLRRLLP